MDFTKASLLSFASSFPIHHNNASESNDVFWRQRVHVGSCPRLTLLADSLGVRMPP